LKKFNETKSDCIYGDLVYTEQDDTQKVKRFWKSGIMNSNSFLFGWMPPHPTFFVKKSIYEKFGIFNTNLKSAADYELMLRFVYKHKIKTGYLPQILVRMRIGGISNSSFLNRIRANKEDRMAWKLNHIKPYFFTLWLKPIRKITQFLKFRLVNTK
jgi:glycosyltransferase